MFLVMLSIGLKSNDMQISLTQGGIFFVVVSGWGAAGWRGWGCRAKIAN